MCPAVPTIIDFMRSSVQDFSVGILRLRIRPSRAITLSGFLSVKWDLTRGFSFWSAAPCRRFFWTEHSASKSCDKSQHSREKLDLFVAEDPNEKGREQLCCPRL